MSNGRIYRIDMRNINQL